MIAVTGDGAIAQRNARPPARGIIGIGGKRRRLASNSWRFRSQHKRSKTLITRDKKSIYSDPLLSHLF